MLAFPKDSHSLGRVQTSRICWGLREIGLTWLESITISGAHRAIFRDYLRECQRDGSPSVHRGEVPISRCDESLTGDLTVKCLNVMFVWLDLQLTYNICGFWYCSDGRQRKGLFVCLNHTHKDRRVCTYIEHEQIVARCLVAVNLC